MHRWFGPSLRRRGSKALRQASHGFARERSLAGANWIELLERRLMLDAVSWKSTASGSWDVAGNWSTGNVPTASDDVTISQPGVTVTVSGADAVHSLTSSDAIVVSSGSLTLGTDSSTSGTLTIDSGATLTTDGALTLSGDTADNSGTLAVVGGLSFAGATFTNESGGAVDLQADVGIAAASGTNTMHNAGLLEKSAGSGISTVAVDLDNTGTVHVKSGTLSLTGALTQVSSGTLSGGTWDVDTSATLNFGSTANLSSNQATINLVGPNATFTQFASVTTMGGTVKLTGGQGFSAAGDMSISGSVRLDTGTLSLNNHALSIQSGGSLTFGGATGVGGASQITDSGTLNYNGTDTANIGSTVNLSGGTVKVDSGNLTLSGGFGIETGGTYNVASGSVLDLTGGSIGDTFTGTFTGSGAGQVQLGSGSIQIAGGGVTFNFPQGMFQWTGGTITHTFGVGGTLTNTGFMAVNTAGGVNLDGATTLVNQGEIDDIGTGNLAVNGSIDNQAKATFVLMNTGGLSSNGTLSDEGTLKMTGSGTVTETPTFNLNSGTVEVDSGNLTLAGGFGTETDGTYNVAAGSVLDLTGGNAGDVFSGTFTATGAGQVQLSSGNIEIAGSGATFDFLKGVFQWTGGTISHTFGQGATLTNTGFININTTAGVSLDSADTLINQGEIDETGTGNLAVSGSLDNQAKATFVLQSTGGLSAGGTFSNEGTLKMIGSAVVTIAAPFDLNGGTVEVDSGKLVLAASGEGTGAGTNTGGSYVVDQGATLDLNGGQEPTYTGTYTGTGGGQVQVNGGALAIGQSGATFDFAKGMFQWTGGGAQIATLNTSPTFTNTGFMAINVANTLTLGVPLINQGEIDQTGGIGVDAAIDNQATGTFVLVGAAGMSTGTGSPFNNEGMLKMTGSGTDTLGLPINLNDGTIEVDSGDLVFNAGAGVGTFTGGNVVVNQGTTLDLSSVNTTYTGTTFTVAAGATLDLGGSTVNGSFTGAGTVNFPSMTIGIGGVVANVGNFNWTGGGMNGAQGDLTNLGTMTLSGPDEHELFNDGTIDNRGTILQTGTGNLGLHSDSKFPTTLNNEAGAIYDIEADSGIDNPFGGTTTLVNNGLIEKTAGTGGSALLINGSISNTGTIEADSGTLALSGTISQLTADGDLTAGVWKATNGGHLGFPGNIITNHASITLSGVGASVDSFFGLTLIGLRALQANAGSLTLTDGATVATIRQHFNGPNSTQLTATGGLSNSGTLTIGPGSTLTLADIYTQTSSGTLDIGLGGGPASGQFGQIIVTSQATLAGGLHVSLANGYSPAAADSFKVMSFFSETGSFSSFSSPLYHGGDLFQPQVNATNVTLTAPTVVSDLAATTISTAATQIQIGQNLTVNYTVANDGNATPASSWVDSVFLSTSDVLDPSAVLLGRVTHTGALGKGGTYSGTLTAAVPPTLAGNYHVIIEADSQGLVPDANRTNNVLASTTTIVLSYPTLPLSIAGSPVERVQGTLSPGQNQIFAVTVPAGADWSVGLQIMSGLNVAELLVGYESVPTDASNVGQAFTPISTIIDTVVPNLHATEGGTYFVLVHAGSGLTTNTTFSLSAVQANGLTFTSVSPSSIPLMQPSVNGLDQIVGSGVASGSGQITFTVHGQNFTPTTTVSLSYALEIGPGFPTAVNTATAQTIEFQNSQTLYASFTLAQLGALLNIPNATSVQSRAGSGDARLGIEVSDHGQTAGQGFGDFIGGPIYLGLTNPGNGFTHNPDAGGQLSIQMVTPAGTAVRAGSQTEVTIKYSNVGNADMGAPLLIVRGTNATLRLPGQTTFQGSDLPVLGINPDGPAGILAPGASGSFTVIVQSTSSSPIDLDVGSIAPATTIDWASMQDAMRPANVDPTAWGAIFANYMADVGTNYGSYQAALDTLATYLGHIGIVTNDTNRLQAFQFEVASDFGAINSEYFKGTMGLGRPDPNQISASIDARGNVTIDNNGAVRTFTVRPDGSYQGEPGDLSTVTVSNGAVRLTDPGGSVTQFSSAGQVDYTEDPNGNRITRSYTNGLLTGLTNSAGDSYAFSYNGQGLLSQQTDPVGRAVSYSYDSAGRMSSATSPQGTTTYTYVGGTNPANMNAIASVTDPDGTQTNFQYDAQGRLIGQSQRGGADPITREYGPGGLLVMSDATNDQTVVYRDETGAMAKLITPLGNPFDYTAANSATGSALTVVGPDGVGSLNQFNALGEMTSATTALGQQTQATYGPLNELTSVTGPSGNSLQYGYDTNGALASIAFADKSQQTFAYNASGYVTSSTSRSGQPTQFSYDSHGLLTSETLPDGTQQTFTYDAHRNLSTVVTPAGTTKLSYDGADRLLKATYPTGASVAYAYNAGGQRISMTTNTGTSSFTENYVYDPLGRLSKVTDGSGNLLAGYSYNSDGRLVRVDNGNGTFTTYQYDAAGNMTQLVNDSPSANALSSFTYSYDIHGRVTKATTAQGSFAYSYDAAGQLVSVTTPGGETINYAYDADGNRVAVTEGGTTTAYTSNNLDQYTAIGSSTLGYDGDGNLASVSGSNGSTRYTYNAVGQLASVVTPTDTITYQYDTFGNLMSTTDNGKQTFDLVDPLTGNLLAQYGANGAATAQYAYGLGLVSQQQSGGNSYYYGFDVTGDTVLMTDGSGKVANSYSYLPYGDLLQSSGTVSNPFTYVGQYGVTSGADGLYQMGIRWYRPNEGRFLSPDPVAEAQGAPNLYVYAGNSPVNGIDPGGAVSHPPYVPAHSAMDWVLKQAEYGEIDEAYSSFFRKTGGDLGTVSQAVDQLEGIYLNSLGSTSGSVPTSSWGREFLRNSYNEDLGQVNGLLETVQNGLPPGYTIDSIPRTNGNVINLADMAERAQVNLNLGLQWLDGDGTGSATSTAANPNNGTAVPPEPPGSPPTAPNPIENPGGPPVAPPPGALGTLSKGLSFLGAANFTLDPSVGTFSAFAFQSNSNVYPFNDPSIPNATAAAHDQAVKNLELHVICDGIAGIGSSIAIGAPLASAAVTFGALTGGVGFVVELVIAGGVGLASALICKNLLAVTSHDPNQIIGPSGNGAANYVNVSQTLPYTVEFQNEPTATAPAQTVTVTQQLDPNLDLSTFQLGNMGFGGTTIQVPAGLTSYNTRVALPSTAPGAGPNGLLVDVSAALNSQTGLVTWTFTSLDPSTMDLPINPLEGFLPPDNGNGDGEGFVSYTVKPKSTATTGNAINAQATVVFDTNPPIDTKQISNTIDAAPPTSSVTALPTDSPGNFTVSWSGQDDAGGSGIDNYSVFVSDNGGPFTAFQTDTTATSAVFTGQPGHTYGFYSVAMDNVGNTQTLPSAAQASTTVVTTLPASTVNPLPSTSPLSFTVSWSASGTSGTGAPTFSVFVSDNGGTFTAFQTDTTATSATFTGQAGHSYGFYSVVTDSAGNVQATPTAAQATTALPSDLNSLYVVAVYLDVLGRTPDSGGLQFWTQQLDGGTPVSSVAQAIAHSAEYYQKFVIEPAYLSLLGRPADSAGIQFWVPQMQGGLTDQELEAGFVASDEFFTKAGGTDKNWVDAVYQLLLSRPADSGGESFWDGQLAAGLSREQAAVEIANSQENNTNLINADYFHYLGRPADPAGLQFWLAQFAAGQTNEDVIAGFTGSAEYYKEHTTGTK